MAGLTCYKPGKRSRMPSSVREHRGRRGEPKGIGRRDLLVRAHIRLGGPIVLVRDNLRMNLVEPLREFIADHADRLTVFPLPSYSPDADVAPVRADVVRVPEEGLPDRGRHGDFAEVAGLAVLERGALAGPPVDLLGDAVHAVGDHPFEVGCERFTVPVPAPGHQVDDDDERLGGDLLEGVDLLHGGNGDPSGDVLRRDNTPEEGVGCPAPVMGVPKDLHEIDGKLLRGVFAGRSRRGESMISAIHGREG
ncbi:hypothetical protein [Streptomyces sp. NPDC093089]|uniref:hypothetical protein n=1 Tax=Streptomyces sp. NPDC093089 TaxID=3366024 RepID=UPI0038288DB3